MRRHLRLSPTVLGILVALGAVAVVLASRGGQMFSPGGLSAQRHEESRLGGVSSHADLDGNCAACHAAPWSKSTMANLCLECHSEVRKEIEAHRSLHGLLSESTHCRDCHSEHNGPNGNLTNLARFDHDCAAFKLTGKHLSVACQSCHADNHFKGTPQTCVSCHADPPIHKGRFGTSCASCHSTETWTGATFKHTFPLDHRNKRQPIACATCHTGNDNYQTYTCYGCHAHQPRKMERVHSNKRIERLEDCARCHPNGGEHERGEGRRKDLTRPRDRRDREDRDD
jgi:hypothetical protein